MIRRILRGLLIAISLIFLTGFFAGPLQAQTGDGFEETWLDGLTMFGVIWFRPEYRGNYDFDKTTDDIVEFANQKVILGFEKKFSDDLIARISIQDARVWGGTPGSDTGLNTANDFTNEGTDIREAWLEMRRLIGPVHLRAGRQRLFYGDQRLVGHLDWTAPGRSFDGFLFKLETKFWDAHAWAMVIAEEDNDTAGNNTAVGSSNSSGFSFTCDETTLVCTVRASTARELDDAYFTGFYNTLRFGPWLHMDLYYLGVHKKWIQATEPAVPGPGTQITSQDRSRQRDELYTFGGRLTNRTGEKKEAPVLFHLGAGKKTPVTLDYTFEYAYQTGVTGETVDAKWDLLGQRVQRADIAGVPLTDSTGAARTEAVYKEKVIYDAYAGAADVGVRVGNFRLGAEYNVGSGDPDRTDGVSATFNNLFHTNHLHYGFADQVSWRNMRARSVNFTIFMGKMGKLRLAYWEVDKHRLQDAWYGSSGAIRSGFTTESNSNARFGNTLNADGSLDSRGAGLLKGRLFREYDLTYDFRYKRIDWQFLYSVVIAGDAAGDVKDDVLSPQATRTMKFDPRATYAGLFMLFKF